MAKSLQSLLTKKSNGKKNYYVEEQTELNSPLITIKRGFRVG